MSKETKQKNLFKPELLDEILKGYKTPEDMFGKDGILKQLQKAILERALEGEMTTELGYAKHDAAGDNSGNSRNGYSEKTIKSGAGEFPIQVPRDRNGNFEPKIIPKNQTRFTGLDDKIISLYARGKQWKGLG